jgi:putative phosphoribosyl transferase
MLRSSQLFRPPDRAGDGRGDSSWRFEDRADAGRQLADRLLRLRDERPIVLALPRGGVPVGYEVARALGAPLDVFLVRKLGVPGQRELGMGAIAPGDVQILNMEVIRALGITREEVERIAAEERAELARRMLAFRGDRPMPAIRGRSVILVDDGLATGVTARAAIRALRQLGPKRIVLAVPVCAPETAEALRPDVDELVCVQSPHDFLAVGYWYHRFDQTSDNEVVELLGAARGQASESAGEKSDAAQHYTAR